MVWFDSCRAVLRPATGRRQLCCRFERLQAEFDEAQDAKTERQRAGRVRIRRPKNPGKYNPLPGFGECQLNIGAVGLPGRPQSSNRTDADGTRQ